MALMLSEFNWQFSDPPGFPKESDSASNPRIVYNQATRREISLKPGAKILRKTNSSRELFAAPWNLISVKHSTPANLDKELKPKWPSVEKRK